VECTCQHRVAPESFWQRVQRLLMARCWIIGWCWNFLDVFSMPQQRMWLADLWFGVGDLFFFLLNFHFKPLNFQSNYLICFSFNFDPCYFDHHFLFEIIYKIRIDFQFHHSFIFFFIYHIWFLFIFIFLLFFYFSI